MSNTVNTLILACPQCRVNIEFGVERLGESADCPNCGNPVALNSPTREAPKPKRIPLGLTRMIILVLILAAFATLGWFFQSGGKADRFEIAGMGISNIFFVGLFVLCLSIVLAWIWFPFMVSKKMDAMLLKMDEVIRLQGREK